MNQEENKNVSSAPMGVNNSANTNSTTNNDRMLAGSPGIMIAPVTEGPRDATAADKGRVNAGTTPTATPPVQPVTQTKAPVLNPTVVSPRVEVTSATTATPPPVAPEPVAPIEPVIPPKKSRKAGFFIVLLLLIIIGMGAYIYMDYTKDQARGECSPLVASDNSLRELDLESSIVQELYDKVKTTVREDLAYHTFDDTLKLYLAYRQIPNSEIYDSNCNLFNENSMSNFTCTGATNFTPMAFSEETLQKEVRKLFGESVSIPNQNIVLGNSCFGGYQYIAERGEYVQGYCGQVPTTTYNVEKELISASVQGDTITLREKVRYYSAQGIGAEQLQNGVYVHTFKLDNHYHYAYVNRTIEGAS
ncbi:MAG TPA: hypothetical protein IAD45_01750 [Candidatus Faecimonas intestinavium]|nr:hypothetical protein [Candidatus Faecimonas intestinavium]